MVLVTHKVPSARGDMIHHSREQVSPSPLPPDRTTNNVHVVHINRIYVLFCSFADHKSNVAHNIEFVGYRVENTVGNISVTSQA